MMRQATNYKQAAVEQSTADPCGSSITEGEQGSKEYFENLLRGRLEYGTWMPDSLGYDETARMQVLDVGCGQGWLSTIPRVLDRTGRTGGWYVVARGIRPVG